MILYMVDTCTVKLNNMKGGAMENTERLTLTVDEAGRLLGISRPTAFKLCHEGSIPTIRLGRRLVVPKVQFEKLLAGGNDGTRTDTIQR